jgi:hypothetical protein
VIQFNASFLAALMPFRAMNDVRYYLGGIHVTPHPDGGALLIATNGHIMMCVYDTSATCSEAVTFALGADAVKHCGARVGQPPSVVTINPITQRLTISSGVGQELYLQPGKCLLDYAEKPDGAVRTSAFPDWRRIVPKVADLKPGYAGCVQAKYIEQAARSHPLRGKRHMTPAIRFWQVNETGIVAVEYEGAPEYMGLIMPMRLERLNASYDAPSAASLWQKAFAPTEPATDPAEKLAA